MPKSTVTKTSRAKKAAPKKTRATKAVAKTASKTVSKTAGKRVSKSASKTVAKSAAKPVAKKSAKKTVAKPATKARRTKKSERDIEKAYTNKQFVAKLRRLANSIEKGNNFQIMVAGEKIYVPDAAIFNIEHEREKDGEELEFQIKWNKAA